MPRRRLPFRADDRGNMAVEFALVAPIMMTLIIGVADFGIAAREKATLQAAARAGLQAVLVDADDTDGAEAIAETMAPAATVAVDEDCACSDGSAVACDGTCAVGSVRRWVTVTASRDLTLLFPWPGVDDPLPIEGVAMARVE